MKHYNPYGKIKHTQINILFTYICQAIIFYIFVIFRKKVLVQHPQLSISYNKLYHANWGDDLNVFFLDIISKDKILCGQYLVNGFNKQFPWLRKYDKYRFIGSIISFGNDPNTIIWGSGLIRPVQDFKRPIKKILAVRGPLTRKELLKNGYDCPEVYGDPALLLPYYVTPRKTPKRYKLGIIPHYTDFYKEELNHFKNDPNILVIKMFDYKNWTDIIDQICSCDFIASSSLHGLIVAEAYNVPNLWIEVDEPIAGDENMRFKFHDFFQSIGLDREYPYIINENITQEDLCKQKIKYVKAPGLSVVPLITACPFTLKTPITPFQ